MNRNYCLYCGKKIPVDYNFHATYCSKTCINKARWLRRRDSVLEKQKIKRINKKINSPKRYCLYCGKEINKLEHPNKVFCSKECSKNIYIHNRTKKKYLMDKDFLYQKYIIEECSSKDIAPIFGCSYATVISRLIEFGISRRVTGVAPHPERVILKIKKARERQNGENHPRFGLKNSPEQKRKFRATMIARGNMPIKEKNPMWGKHHTKETKDKVRKIFLEHKVSQLENNPNWQGGISFKPYDKKFNSHFKDIILERDDYKCLYCGIDNFSAKKLYKQGLHVHHIDYDKMNTTKKNCCALCCKCNIRANYHRLAWTKYYHWLLNWLYGYEYAN